MGNKGGLRVVRNYEINEFLNDVDSLGRQVMNEWRVDCIVAVTRGGLAPAAWLSQSLSVKNIHTVGGFFRGDGGFQYNVRPDYSEITGNALFVSDLCRSGRILQRLINDSRDISQAMIPKIACLHFSPSESCLTPVFFVHEISPTDWIRYPWESTV